MAQLQKAGDVMREIILLRGLFRGSFHWGDFPTTLQHAFPHCSVTCIDIPGNGELSALTSPMSVAAMVESIRAQRQGKGSVHLLAISMGGMIGLKWAELYPSEIQSLICINTSAKGFSPFYERLLPQNYFKILKALASKPLARESAIYQMVANQPLDINIVNAWAKYGNEHPMSVGNFLRQLYAASTFKTVRPQCELHFISSTQDRLVSCKASQAIANAWHSPLITNDTDGHDIPLDNPQWLINTISTLWQQASTNS
ncbi:alpha/beta fold hydrolase [Photobacterium lucens]|uniref:alpha/beta fold hydrolase n=1 Tax=Photobacterium lucens TaxID=2562949 RepID=UPI00136D8602|nr:alpha/beta hydrolase [Photobacterium lucens]MBP2701892.1 alpha/beta hydrolase [Vibrio parahaemolyticus]MZG56770.1 alpha/beta hydrolase [Photobacterium lucens]MZG79457.1 alpha/beta hydrolase [Photobacterium lucens]